MGSSRSRYRRALYINGAFAGVRAFDRQRPRRYHPGLRFRMYYKMSDNDKCTRMPDTIRLVDLILMLGGYLALRDEMYVNISSLHTTWRLAFRAPIPRDKTCPHLFAASSSHATLRFAKGYHPKTRTRHTRHLFHASHMGTRVGARSLAQQQHRPDPPRSSGTLTRTQPPPFHAAGRSLASNPPVFRCRA
jgi:hypothetical protein